MMQVQIPESRMPRHAHALFAALSAVVIAFWVAICAAAPEFIWQGFKVAWTHFDWSDVLSALFLGLILAFFVEPLVERLRDFLHSPSHHASRHEANALFAASLGFAFALVSICLHHALTAFIAGHGATSAEHNAGLVAGIALAAAWAIVPFAVTLAWLSVENRYLAVPLGMIGCVAPGAAGWLFAWSIQDTVATTIPTLAILGFGYRHVKRGDLSGRAGTVLCVAAIWLAIASFIDAILGLFHAEQFELYTASSLWIDARFYLGWILGLRLAPSPPR